MPFNPKSLQNLVNTGRPKGAVGKTTRWKRELAAPGLSLDMTPTQILAANMQYFQAKADEVLAETDAAIKRGVPAAELQRQFEEACRFKVMANEAAVQLAPYVHSKMPTLDARPDQEAQQYVIRVPDALPDGQAWSHAITDIKTISADPQMNGSRRDD